MDSTLAGHLATAAAHFFSQHPEHREGERANRANTAFAHQAADFIPDGAHAAVIEHHLGLPLIVAATETSLYAIDIPVLNDDSEPAESRCRMRQLDPELGQAEVETRYRGSYSEGKSRHSTYRLRVDDITLEIRVRSGPDKAMDDRELLARHIATRLGWEFPSTRNGPNQTTQ